VGLVFHEAAVGANHTYRVLIATIRNKGICPCPRCLVSKANLDKIGHVQDKQSRTTNVRTYARYWVTRAREFIYKLGRGVTSTAVENVLTAHSLVPTLV
jgi:hypothetical protein